MLIQLGCLSGVTTDRLGGRGRGLIGGLTEATYDSAPPRVSCTKINAGS